MKLFSTTIFCLMVVFFVSGQANEPTDSIETSPTKNMIYDHTNTIDVGYLIFQPSFICGESIQKAVSENFIYPKELINSKEKTEGYLVLNFVVTKTGGIDDIRVLRGLHELLDQEAIRVLESMKNCYKPGTLEGKPVNVRYQLPLKF